MFKDTAVVSKVLDHKVTDRLFKVFMALAVPGFLFLLNMVYMMKASEREAQWRAIKRASDDVSELKLQVGVIERVHGIKIGVHGGHDNVVVEDDAPNPANLPIDIKKAWLEIEKARREKKDEDVEEWANMEQRNMKGK